MRRLTVIILLFAIVISPLFLVVDSVQAGLDIDLGATLQIGDNTEIFIAVSSRYFDQEPENVRNWQNRYHDPDDLAVALFLARRSGKSPKHVFSLRQQGLPWFQIGVQLGLPMDIWFLPVKKDPGPPYGKAYGHWKKRQKSPGHEFVLTDTDIHQLVAVRVLHEYYDVPVTVAMEWRSSGKDIRVLVSAEYEKRHGPAAKSGKSASTKGNKKAEKSKGKH